MMWKAKMLLAGCLSAGLLTSARISAQDDDDDFTRQMADPAGHAEPIEGYESFIKALGGDSVRKCLGQPCNGWVEDHYADGAIMHRGYHEEGRLVTYKNYYDDGTLEREFKTMDAGKCLLRTYHRNGTLRSETRYTDGRALVYLQYYSNGRLRLEQEKHRSEPYYLKLNLYAFDGRPISTLMVVDKKKNEIEQCEYYPGGGLRCRGRARYDPDRMDSIRIGSWTYYDRNGKAVKQESYVAGKVHETKVL